MPALYDSLTAMVQRLAPLGWNGLLAVQGLDLGAADLVAEFSRALTVDRTAIGFEDYSLNGTRAIEPGRPDLSLLFHALASPDVVLPPMAGVPAPAASYPTLQEIDALENYIFSLRPPAPSDLTGTVVAVFSYEYRPAYATTHKRQADYVFSPHGDLASRGDWSIL